MTPPVSAIENDKARADIDARIPGWSNAVHWHYFDELVASGVRSICMLGVYAGRDIAYLLHHFHQAHLTDFRIVGVDLFADVPGADWTPEQAGKSWRDAGYGCPPSLSVAQSHVAAACGADRVPLLQCNELR